MSLIGPCMYFFLTSYIYPSFLQKLKPFCHRISLPEFNGLWSQICEELHPKSLALQIDSFVCFHNFILYVISSLNCCFFFSFVESFRIGSGSSVTLGSSTDSSMISSGGSLYGLLSGSLVLWGVLIIFSGDVGFSFC